MALPSELDTSGRIPPFAIQPRIQHVQPQWDGQRGSRCFYIHLLGKHWCPSHTRRLELSVQLGTGAARSILIGSSPQAARFNRRRRSRRHARGSVSAEARGDYAASQLGPGPPAGAFLYVCAVRIERGAVGIAPVGTVVGAITALLCIEAATGRREVPAPRPGRNGVLTFNFQAERAPV